MKIRIVNSSELGASWAAEDHVEGPQVCEWFALCENPATGTTPHPILGAVPTCDRCAKRAGR